MNLFCFIAFKLCKFVLDILNQSTLSKDITNFNFFFIHWFSGPTRKFKLFQALIQPFNTLFNLEDIL